MNVQDTNTETPCNLPKQPFLALGIAALWFFIYILVHETITAWHQEKSSPTTSELLLSPQVAASLPNSTIKNLRTSYSEGAKLLSKCIICHDVNNLGADAPRYGPLIAYPFGTVAGSQDYEYSPALKTMATYNKPWTVQQLWAFIHDPDSFAEETRMPFDGITVASQKRDLLHYFAWSCGLGCEDPVLLKLDIKALETRKSTETTIGDCAVVSTRLKCLKFDPFESDEYLLVPREYVSCRDSSGRVLRDPLENNSKRLEC